MRINKLLALAFLLCLMPSAHLLADEYIKPSFENMVNTAIRFGALSIGDDLVIDDYAIISECEIYANYSKNDFKWQRIRELLRQKIRQDATNFPTAFAYEAELQLDKYDFKNKIFNFKEKATIKNVNAFVIFSTEGKVCANQSTRLVPRAYRAVVDQPIYFTGIPLGEKDAEALLNRMFSSGNSDRIVHARFKLRIVYVSPLRRIPDEGRKNQPQLEQDGAPLSVLKMDAQLEGLEIYEDAEHTRLLYNYQPI